MKKILIINTGGTISSIKTSHGYEPKIGYVASIMSKMPALTHEDMPSFDLIEYNPLLDSSNMGVSDWNRIGKDIASHHEDYDGFVVFHGTDTMAYTASALSFMLEHLKKPVILTGSQIPLSEVRNDAAENIVTALWLCAHRPLPEVCIYFNHRLLRGNRSQKTSAQTFNAFASPNFPMLANIGIDIELREDLILKISDEPFSFQDISSHFIANFRIFPGFSAQILKALLEQPLQGLILETYGAGNAQNNDPMFLDTLKQATDRGIVIVNCSQCLQGHVEMGQYATGYGLFQAGLISGKDMTPEAAHCKLLYLLSKGLSVKDIRLLMPEPLVGELS